LPIADVDKWARHATRIADAEKQAAANAGKG